MEPLPSLEMPKEFTQLLQLNLQQIESGQSHDSLYKYIIQSEVLCALIETHFQHLYPQGKVHHFLRTLGWKNFRDRLASIYLHYLQYGSFPGVTSVNSINDIVNKELQFEKYTINGHSRLFLFFYYLKMAQSNHFGTPFPDNDLEQIIQYAGRRTWTIDWTLLILWHFHSFIGKKKLLNILKYQREEFRFQSLLKNITHLERRLLFSNLLNYSFSIQDRSLFVESIS